MHGPIFNRKGDQVGYVEGDWAIDRSGQKRWLVDEAKLLDPKTLEVVGHLTDAGKINTPQDKSPAGNDDSSRLPLRCGKSLEAGAAADIIE